MAQASEGKNVAKLPRPTTLSRPTFSRQQFARLDKDHTNKISKQELLSALASDPAVSKETAEAWTQQVYRDFDSTRTGALNLDDFTDFVNSQAERLYEVFDELDVSNTGTLNSSDVGKALAKANVSHLDDQVAAVLKKLGAKNGVVTWEQFLEASFVLPNLSSQEYMLTLTSNIPLGKVPPATAPWMLILAGFCSGAVSRTMTAPFDRLRAALAVGRESSVRSATRNIMQTQGMRGFWTGNAANVVQVGPENAIQFTINKKLRERLEADGHKLGILESFAVGSISGATAMTAVYPMYVIQNRMAAAEAGQYSSIMDCVRKGMQNGGMRGMFGGYGVALIRNVPLKGIMLGGTSTLTDMVKDPETGYISTPKMLACSAVAGGIAHAATYPLHLARTVLQQEVQPGGMKYDSFVHVLRHRFQTQGLRGCYAGLPIWLCNRIPAVAIEFAVNARALDAISYMAKSS